MNSGQSSGGDQRLSNSRHIAVVWAVPMIVGTTKIDAISIEKIYIVNASLKKSLL